LLSRLTFGKGKLTPVKAKGESQMAKKKLTDADVFKAFGVGPKEKSLRAFISGQRRINGRLYKAIDLIGDALKAERAGRGKKHDTCVDQACKINEVIPGDPPGCNDRGLGGT
jgi:hypothetical protein